MQFSDSKYLERAFATSKVNPIQRVNGDILSSLRGVGDAKRRAAQALLPDAEGNYEPVTFQHPENGRRMYGWLVAVDSNGDARVEVGDGEFAVVPPSEIRRLGQKEDRAKIQAQLRRAIGQVSTDGLGIRADIHEVSSPSSLGDDETLKLLTLSYAATLGAPTEEEVSAYVQRFYPNASIVEADGSMPGRIGVAIRSFEEDRTAEVSVDAEMGAAHGGEVEEVLDPSDVVDSSAKPLSDPDAKSHRDASTAIDDTSTAIDYAAPTMFQRDAIFGIGNKKTPNVSAGDVAKTLAQNRNEGFIEQAMKVFMDNGGGRAFVRSQGSLSLPQVLAMAMPIVKRADPKLWNQLAAYTMKSMAGQPAPAQEQPEQPFGMAGPQMQQVMKPAQTTPSGVAVPDVQELANQQMQEHEQMESGEVPSPTAPASPAGMAPGNNVGQKPDPYNLSASPPGGTGPLTGPAATPYQDPYANTGYAQGVTSPEGVNVGGAAGMKQGTSKRAAVFDNAQPPSEKRVEQGYSHLTSQGLPPSMTEIFNTMKVHRFARRGDYVMARVEWEPDCMHGRTAHAVMNTVKTFVVAKCGAMRQGANFGIMGKVYVLKLDQAKGVAEVQFASEFPGPSATEVVER